MANSQKTTLSMSLTDGTNRVVFAPPQVTVAPSAFNIHQTFQVLSTTAESLSLGDLASPKRAYIKNLDAAIIVYAGFSDSGTVKPFEIAPGEVACIGIKSGLTPSLQAASGTPKVWVLVTDA